MIESYVSPTSLDYHTFEVIVEAYARDPFEEAKGVTVSDSVSQVLGFMKGKSAICIARQFAGRRQNFTGQHFWARGFYVSTAGRDVEVVRAYIRNQEKEDRRLDEQLRLFE